MTIGDSAVDMTDGPEYSPFTFEIFEIVLHYPQTSNKTHTDLADSQLGPMFFRDTPFLNQLVGTILEFFNFIVYRTKMKFF